MKTKCMNGKIVLMMINDNDVIVSYSLFIYFIFFSLFHTSFILVAHHTEHTLFSLSSQPITA